MIHTLIQQPVIFTFFRIHLLDMDFCFELDGRTSFASCKLSANFFPNFCVPDNEANTPFLYPSSSTWRSKSSVSNLLYWEMNKLVNSRFTPSSLKYSESCLQYDTNAALFFRLI